MLRGLINDMSSSLYIKAALIDRMDNTLIYLSAGSYNNVIKTAAKELNKKGRVNIYTEGFFRTAKNKYNISIKKNDAIDCSHLVALAKDKITYDTNGNESALCYFLIEEDKDLPDITFKKLSEFSSIPILEEWKEYVTDKLENYGYLMKLSEINNEYDYKDTYKGYRLRLDKKSLLEIIQDGLINKEININGSNEESPILKSIKGIDSYLSLFGEQLAKKIQESFKPLCNPLTDKDQFADYIDDYIYGETNGNKELFLGQKTIMQAVKKSLDVNKSTFIIAEMGSGKTLMGANIPYIHHANRNKGYNTIVMCPSHLVNVWEREIKESVPNSRVYIINTFRELIELKSKLLMKDKVENTYIVMSKESARNNYLKRPAAVWNKIKKCYVCPDCGKPLFYKKKNEILFLNELDMLTENSINSVCNNKITKWIDGEKVEVKCNAKLWQPFSNEKNHTWIKLGSDGFISKCNISNIINNLESTDKLSKKETAFLKKLKDKAEEIKEGNDKSSYSGYRRYSIAKYIKKYMKDCLLYTSPSPRD